MFESLHEISRELLAALSAALIIVVWFLLRNFLKHLMEDFQKILRKLDYVIIEQQSTDHALNESFKNGYSVSKKEKREALLKEYEFKHNIKVEL